MNLNIHSSSSQANQASFRSQAEQIFLLILLMSRDELARLTNKPNQAKTNRAELARRPTLVTDNRSVTTHYDTMYSNTIREC
jgi:hypothetical protein